MTTDTTAPVKDQPHPFQPTPEVPLVYARAGAEQSDSSGGAGAYLDQPDTSNCALCNSPRAAKIHDGTAEAEAEPIRWG